MRCWGTASLLLLTWGTAVAQPSGVEGRAKPSDESEPPANVLGYGALPGGVFTPSAVTLPASTFAFGMLGGYGFRNTLLSADHKFTRGIGDLAVAFAPIDILTFALQLDGRFDKHTGFNDKTDDGYVGDPHLLIRLGKGFGKLHAGGQVGVWIPGKKAPSIAANATTIDARGLLSIGAGPATVNLSAGFRIDNSAKSVDDRMKLSVEDRVSLGVSDYHAVLVAANVSVPTGKAFVGAEVGSDVFVGSDSPGPIIRFGASGGFHVTKQLSVYAFVQGAKVPGIPYGDAQASTIKLVPYEPVFTGGVGLTGQFGGKKVATGGNGIVEHHDPVDVLVDVSAALSGTVVDESGAPVAGATVHIKQKTEDRKVVTDAKGAWSVQKVKIGSKAVNKDPVLDDVNVEVHVEVEKKKPSVTTLVLKEGDNTAPPIKLEPVIAPSQFRATIVIKGSGRPIAGATVKLEPGGFTGTTDGEGNVTIKDIPQGKYSLTISAQGFKDDASDIELGEGVFIKNAELGKK